MDAKGTCRSCGVALPGRLRNGPCPRCLARLAWAVDDLVEDLAVAGSTPGRIGNYALEAEIARGGMGVVYRATQQGLNRPVAVKVLLNGPFSDRESRERFLAEARTAAGLRHPGIVAVHEVGVADGQPFFSMDLVEGSNLAAVVSGQPISAGRAVRYLLQMAQAVAHAHRQGILHRDLKPSNILIESSTDEARVTDFGLAKQMEAGIDQPNLTQSGSQLGSPHYMPPEQVEVRRGAATPASDIWSLGAIFYELLTGRPPFNGDSALAIFRQVLEQDPVPPRRLNPDVPRDLETICLKCLRKNPSQRYVHGAALVEELERCGRGEPILARPVPSLEKVALWCRRKPALAGAIGLSLGIAVAGTLGILAQWRRAELLKNQAQDEAARARAFSAEASLQAYAADMRVVSDAVRDGDLGMARDRLRAWMPQPGDVDRREFAWRYLSQEVQSESLGVVGKLDWIVTSVACSPDGEWLAAAGMDSPAKVWNARTGSLAASFSNRVGTWQVGFMAEGRRLLVGGADGAVRVFAWPERELVAEFPGQTFSFSGDGRRLVTCAGNPNQWEVTPGVVRLWDLPPNPALWPQVTAHPRWETPNADSVRAAISPDGREVVTTDGRESLRWLDAATGNGMRTLPLGGRAWTLSFAPDGERLAVSGWGDSIRIFDRSRLEVEPRTLRIPNTDLLDVAWSADGQRLAVSSTTDRRLRVIEAPSGRTLLTLAGHDDEAWAVCFHPDGRRLLSGSKDQTVQLWRTEARRPAPERASSSWAVPVWLDATHLLVHSTNGPSVVWNGTEGTSSELGGIGVGPGPEPGSIWIRNREISVSLWMSGRTSPHLVHLEGTEKEGAGSPQYHGQSSTFWEVLPDGQFREWEAATGRMLAHFPTTPFPYGFPYERSPDGSRLVVAGQTNGIQMFAIPEGRLLWRAPLRVGGHMDTVDALAFSPDGSQLASGGRDGKLFLWDTASGKRIVELTGHRGTVNAVAWSPDGSTLATTEAPLGVRLFHAATRREIALLPIPNVLYWLRFSPDGRKLAVLLREPGSSLDQPAFRVRLLTAADQRMGRKVDE